MAATEAAVGYAAPLLGVVLGLAGGLPGGAVAADDEPPALLLAPGHYELIGRYPDSARTYAGRARIERVGQRLRLTRRVAGQRLVAFGEVRRADPGEAWVLVFAWGAGAASREMVCLVGSDLDNYGRLTCHWGRPGNPHRRPGVEAYFAREPWEPAP